MRSLLCSVVIVLIAGALSRAAAQATQTTNLPASVALGTQPDAETIDQAIDRIIAREHYENTVLGYFHPIIATHIEDMKLHGGEQIPWRTWDLRGRASASTNLAVRSASTTNQFNGYQAIGFLQEAFIDREGFDRQHYSFRYVGREDFAGSHCLIFDVEPLPAATSGRFHGRIWAEDETYTIIRFSGTFMPLHHWELFPTPTRRNEVFAGFDSRRSSVLPGIWLPSDISSQKMNMRSGPQRWDFNAETQFSDYSVAGVQSLNIPPYSQEKFQKVIPPRYELGKSFWIPWAANFALMITANELTAHCLHNGCVEGDPLLPSHPTRPEMYAVRGGLLTVAFLLARDSKLKGEELRWKFGTFLILSTYTYDVAHDAYGAAIH